MGGSRQSPRRLGLRRRRPQQRNCSHDGTNPRAGETGQGWNASERTLVICSWDGEEVGLTGSTEWGEQFADELRKKAVVYINVDEATSGPNFHGQAVASLAPMLVETSRTLRDPSGKTLYEAWKESSARERSEAKQPESGVKVADANLADTRIGSGSDHTVFLNFVGMPYSACSSMVLTACTTRPMTIFFWMNHFGDPGYRYHTLMSQLWGVLALRLANADLLPFDFASYASNIREFVSELSKENREKIKPCGDSRPRLSSRAKLAAATRSQTHPRRHRRLRSRWQTPGRICRPCPGLRRHRPKLAARSITAQCRSSATG